MDAAYIIICSRDIPMSSHQSNMKCLRLFKTTHDKILKLWWLASQCVPESFLTVDAPFVLNSIIEDGMHPWNCGRSLCGWSQHRVYAISLPE
jgi:hypothetical protein